MQLKLDLRTVDFLVIIIVNNFFISWDFLVTLATYIYIYMHTTIQTLEFFYNFILVSWQILACLFPKKP